MFKTFLFLSFICTCFLSGKVIETSYVEQIIPLIDKDTWVLVDLDNTLFEGVEAYGHADWFYDEIEEKMKAGMSRCDAIKEIYPIWMQSQKICTVKPLEEAFISEIKSLQSQGIVVMGLTHRQPLIASSTLKQIKSLGINLSETSPTKAIFYISSENPARYEQGVLFVGDFNKKIDIFLNFLSLIHQKPSKIVFIDDNRKNVEELEALLNLDIDYIGIHYTAIERLKHVYNRDIAQYQLNLLGITR